MEGMKEGNKGWSFRILVGVLLFYFSAAVDACMGERDRMRWEGEGGTQGKGERGDMVFAVEMILLTRKRRIL